MAVTAQIVNIGRNNLRYRVTQDGTAGTTVTITSTGGATPDLVTDSVAGPIKALAQVVANGYGPFAAGTQTQAKARNLWLNDTVNGGGAANLPYARCELTQRGTTPAGWSVDANVSGGNPIIVVTAPAAAGVCYLDISVPGQIGA